MTPIVYVGLVRETLDAMLAGTAIGYRFRWMFDSDKRSGSSRCIVASCTDIIHTGIASKERIADLLSENLHSEP